MTKYLPRKIILIAGAIIAVLIVAVGVLGWKYYQITKDNSNKSQEVSKKVIQKVSSLYLVPTNEEPTVAQIQDKDKIKNQEFFKSAKNGDYLLIYQKNKIALVYRESSNKLVNVGPVNVGDSGTTAGAQTETPAP